MVDLVERLSGLSPKRLALLAVELQTQLDERTRARHEAIAVVGIGCRFPGGADGPDAFWRLLRDGVDAITEIPPERWDVDAFYDPDPATPGKMSTRWGGFLRDIDRFDARLFGIAPREAVSMDPQQRVLMEVVWEALEHAGLAPDGLVGSRTGVFFGASGSDYRQLIGRLGDPAAVDAYALTGTALNALAGRVSYIFGLQGPSLVVDTACSSALVAVHLACQALRAGECRLALAGGVNLILVPDGAIVTSRAHMMAADGRCKTFDAAADGFVRSEGCGVVVLKRLSDAEADGDQILALIRGSAVNQDGASSGFTVPNGQAQEALIRSALDAAGVAPAQISYVESHGTGTALGDPIEVLALGSVLGVGRAPDRPLLIGSVKTNLGHTEAAAGVAGLIKTVLALQRAEIPPNLHFDTLNPEIAGTDLPIALPTRLTPWPGGADRRAAAVSSFGASGTNAQVVLESASPMHAAARPARRRVQVLPLAAQSEPAIRELAERYADHLTRNPSVDLADACWTAATGRAALPVRLAVVGSSVKEMAEGLAAFAAGHSAPGVFGGQAHRTGGPRVAFLSGGLDAQMASVGATLRAAEPAFRQVFERCVAILDEQPEPSPLAALVAFQFGVVALWRSWGIQPDAALGEGAGEYVAAYVAGALELEVALRRMSLKQPPEAAAAAHSRIPLITGRTGRGFSALSSLGCTAFVELGPGTSLIEFGRGSLPDARFDWLPSVCPGRDELTQLAESVAALWCRGAPVKWAEFAGDARPRRISLPTYPFQRERFWLDARPVPPQNSSHPDDEAYHPLLGRRIRSPALREIVFESPLSAQTPAWLAAHCIWNATILPAAAYAELALAAAAATDQPKTVRELVIKEALSLPSDSSTVLQTILTPGSDGVTPFRIVSRGSAARDEAAWVEHASGALTSLAAEPLDLDDSAGLSDIRARCAEELSVADFYSGLRTAGFEFGDAFQRIDRIWRGKGEALGLVRLSPELSVDAATYQVHPALLDGCLQVVGAAMYANRDEDDLFMPIGASFVRVPDRPSSMLWSHVTVRPNPGGPAETRVFDVRLFDEAGQGVGRIEGLCFRRANQAALLRRHEPAVKDWLYEVVWQPYEPRHTGLTGAAQPTWLIFADNGGLGGQLAQRLSADGADCRVALRAGCAQAAPGAEYVDPSRRDDFTRALGTTEAAGGPGTEIVYLWGLDESASGEPTTSELAAAHAEACQGLLNLVQALVKTGRRQVRLRVVTRGAQSVTDSSERVALAQASLWGLTRVVMREHPEIGAALIDLDPHRGSDDAAVVVSMLRAEQREDQVAVRGDATLQARLVHARQMQRSARPFACRSEATYLITGGSGGLGREVARWLAQHGARHLVLVSRNAPTNGTVELIRDIEQDGTRVLVRQADVADESQVDQLLAEIAQRLPPLRGVVHAAGVLDDGLLVTQDWTRFGRVLAPKVQGAWNLHLRTRNEPLDFFVLFASMAGLFGTAGQGNYAAANAFLDGLAHYRRALDLPAVSIDWGAWGGSGMSVERGMRAQLARWGVRELSPADGLGVLDMALQTEQTQFAALAVDWTTFVRQFPPDKVPAFLAELATEAQQMARPAARPAAWVQLSRRLEMAEPSQQLDALREQVAADVASVLRLEATQLPGPDQPFFEIGMDSLMAVELKDRLQLGIGRALPATLIFEYPTMARLTEYLAHDVLAIDVPAASEARAQPDAARRAAAMAGLDGMTEHELTALLEAELARIHSTGAEQV